jgi:isopenicillin-N epimerase
LFERRMQWQGTRDIAAWLAVPQALDFQARHDWASVRTRCHELARQGLESLTQRYGLAPIARDDDWAQMVAIPVPAQEPEVLRQRLYGESNIEIPVTTHAGTGLRPSFSAGLQHAGDVERLLAAPALR